MRPPIQSLAPAVAFLVLAGCTTSSEPECDVVCGVQNGSSGSTQATYWVVPQLSQTGNAAARIAFFADGSGKLIANSNNCTVPIGSGATSNPIVTSFTWTRSGSSILLSGASFHCSFDPANNRGTITSFTSIVGSTASGTFTTTIFTDWFGGGGNFTANLVAGTL
jgi:hypothetical protein